MKILIINGYPRTAKGLHSFDDFHWSIKKFLNEQKEYIDIETEFVLREIDNIDDFLYEPYSGYARIENANIFDHIDMIFISGDIYLLPWQNTTKKILLLIRMCIRVNKILFLSSFAMHSLIFLCATNLEKNINIINGKGKGGKIGDLSMISKPLKQLTTNDYFLDNVTGDIYNYNNDKDEWIAKANIGLHYEKAAQEYYSLGKFLLKTPTYRVKSLNSLENIFISRNTESICYLKKVHLNHYLLQNLPFEFVLPSKTPWVIHTFSFLNKEKTFIILAETNRGPCIIELKNCVAVEFQISYKYPYSVHIIQNFISHHLKIIKSNNTNSSKSILNYFLKANLTSQLNLKHKFVNQFEARRKINFRVFSDFTTQEYEDNKVFHHAGFATSQNNRVPLILEKNSVLEKFKNVKKTEKLPDINTEQKYNKQAKTEHDIDLTKKNKNYYTSENINNENEISSLLTSKKSIRMFLHPNLSEECLKVSQFWVPGNLSKKKKETSFSQNSQKIETSPKSFNKTNEFRNEIRNKWLADNFKFGKCKLLGK